MRKIEYKIIVERVAEIIDYSLKNIESEAVQLINNCFNIESGERAKWALGQIVENAKIAAETNSYACQDTGLAVFFVEIGNNVFVEGGLIDNAINEGVRVAYGEARKSVADPLNRKNTGDNTPAIIHTRIVEGDKISITYLAKGAGSENMSKVFMLTPSKGEAGIINSVVECVRAAGANPCPPIIVGVGIGGDFEMSAILSKRALCRTSGVKSSDERVAELERKILEAVNNLNIGAAGLGGRATALSVAIETYPTHIGMLPVAINLQCHSVRHKTTII